MLPRGTDLKSLVKKISKDFFLIFHAAELNPFSSYSREGLGLNSTKKHVFKVLNVLFVSLLTKKLLLPEESTRKNERSPRKLNIRLLNEKTSSRSPNQLLRKKSFWSSSSFRIWSYRRRKFSFDYSRYAFAPIIKNTSGKILEIFVTGDLNPIGVRWLVEGTLNHSQNRAHHDH